MKRMHNINRNNKNKNKGFTLMEVIIAIAILGVVMIAISSLLLAGSRYFSLGHEQSNAQADGRLAMDQILDDIRYSKEVTLTTIPSVKESPYNYIYIEDGSVHRVIYDYATGNWSEMTTPGTFTTPDSGNFFIKNGVDGIDIHLKSISDDLRQTYPINATIKLPNYNMTRMIFTSGTLTSAPAIRFKIDNEALLLASLSNPVTPVLTPVISPSLTPAATPTAIPNSIPVASNDSYSTDKNVMLVVPFPGILLNDSDADGDDLKPEIINDVSSGTLNLLSDGSFTYDPKKNSFGVFTFTYKVFDGKSYSNTATVTINVIK